MNQGLTKPADKNEVEQMFRNLFNGGPIRRLPKNKRQGEIFLALAASSLDGTQSYSEASVSEWLESWLQHFSDPIGLDHVTVRRYLVDYSMLLRDPEGSAYRVNQVVVNQVIQLDARSVNPALILEQVIETRNLKRQQRKAEQMEDENE